MKKVLLIIRDGWGYRSDTNENAIVSAPTPYTDKLRKEFPNTIIKASGESVGLPEGYQGNSEVGHMTIGSGRINYQSLVRINKSIETGEFFEIEEFKTAIQNCKDNNTVLHLIGLLQVEGVHAHLNHLLAILELCKKEKFDNVVIHVITDGRDAPVHDSLKNLKSLKDKMDELQLGKVVTISGRYYTMDRNNKWDRTKLAYDCIVNAQCEDSFDDPFEKIQECHNNDETDEFIKPRKHKDYEGIKENDSLIFYNFRTDRTRQLTKACVEPDFKGWETQPLKIYYVGMTQFYKPMNAKVAFKEAILSNLLGEVISNNDLKQLRISETEKYAHVTFFFNGQIEDPFPNEDRILIESPKVATYDLKPEMSVYEIRDKLVENIQTKKYDFIVTNLVNGDMVGHTGITEAIEKAVISVDESVKDIVNTALENDYTILIFADHGNAEDQRPEWRTSHTINPVPFILVSNDEKLKNIKLKENRGLQDIGPTALKLLGIDIPEEMTGEPIFVE